MSRVSSSSIFSRLYNGETDIRFVGRARLWFALSGLVILLGLAAFLTRGLNLGIDFEGGTAWEVPVSDDIGVQDGERVVAEAGLADATVQTLSNSDGRRLRVEADPDADVDQQAVSESLAELAGTDPSEVSLQDVGPSWGDEITSKALRALVIFLIAITIYISLRFEWRMAVATLVALVHDILVTIGVYAITGFEVTPATVIALLTILGYSIYDGIVVFDKVDENARRLTASRSAGGARQTYSAMVDSSLNQVLMRTLNTSITALLPILSLLVIGSLVLGAATLREFALALLVGLASSAYSSIFIASPVLALLKEREPKFKAMRKRVEEDRSTSAPQSTRLIRGADRDDDHGEVDGDAEDVVAGQDVRDRSPVGSVSGRRAAAGGGPAPLRTPKTTEVIVPRARKKGRKR